MCFWRLCKLLPRLSSVAMLFFFFFLFIMEGSGGRMTPEASRSQLLQPGISRQCTNTTTNTLVISRFIIKHRKFQKLVSVNQPILYSDGMSFSHECQWKKVSWCIERLDHVGKRSGRMDWSNTGLPPRRLLLVFCVIRWLILTFKHKLKVCYFCR